MKSTLENLKAALAGEQFEIDTMYRGFIKDASGSAVSLARRSFTWAMEAKKTHAQLYQQAIGLVEKG